jgi:hypothetical protein
MIQKQSFAKRLFSEDFTLLRSAEFVLRISVEILTTSSRVGYGGPSGCVGSWSIAGGEALRAALDY